MRDPSSMEAGDKQQLDRLAATLHRCVEQTDIPAWLARRVDVLVKVMADRNLGVLDHASRCIMRTHWFACRLKLPPGQDVRCAAALSTYKIAALTSRAGPTGGVSGADGTAISYAVNAAMTTGIGQHLPGTSMHDAAGGPAWRPRGVLVSHLHEHRAAVNSLATSSNDALLFSGSDDETVKVRLLAVLTFVDDTVADAAAFLSRSCAACHTLCPCTQYDLCTRHVTPYTPVLITRNLP